jgi:hypothetical protein
LGEGADVAAAKDAQSEPDIGYEMLVFIRGAGPVGVKFGDNEVEAK